MNAACHSVLIVDDHDIVSAGMKALLKKCELYHPESIDTASTYTTMCTLLSQHAYDLLILDLHLEEMNMFAHIRSLSAQYPDMKIVICSMYPEDPYAVACVHEGAAGYLHKTKVLHAFKTAMRTVLEGKIYIDPEHESALHFGTEMQKQEQASLNILSKREFEICHHIASGMSFKEIAQKLDISPKTVSAHHAHILDKLSLSNTAQLIRFMLQHEG